MGNADDQNDQLVVLDFVHHPVVPHPESPEPPQVALQRGAKMRGLGQPVDGGDDARAVRFGQTP